MGPRKLLTDFVFFLPSSKLLELQCGRSRLDATPSDLGRSIPGEPAEGTSTLKSVKGV